MFERFTDRARRVVVLAQEEARLLSHNYIGTEHLLLGLISEGDGLGAKALEGLGIERARVRATVEEIIGSGAGAPAGHIPFTPRAKAVLELSLRESLQLGHNYIGTEHILLGLIREGEGVGAQILIRLGATLDDARRHVIQLLLGHGVPVPRSQPPGATATHGYSPGLRDALDAAIALAGDTPTVGTQHLLAVFASWDDLAASEALRAGGFDANRLEVDVAAWDVGGTRDETPEQWAARVTEVTADEDAVVIRITDPAMRARVQQEIERGNIEGITGALGEALHRASSRLGFSVGEAGDSAEAAAAGGEEHDEEEGGADEDDGGA